MWLELVAILHKNRVLPPTARHGMQGGLEAAVSESCCSDVDEEPLEPPDVDALTSGSRGFCRRGLPNDVPDGPHNLKDLLLWRRSVLHDLQDHDAIVGSRLAQTASTKFGHGIVSFSFYSGSGGQETINPMVRSSTSSLEFG